MHKLNERPIVAPLPGRCGIASFVFFLFLFSSICAYADMRIEAGPTYLSYESSDGWSVAINNRITPKWDIGAGYVSEQTVWPSWEKNRGYAPVDLDQNYFVHGQRIFTFSNYELGIGAAYYHSQNRALGKNLNSSLSLAWNANDVFSVRVRYFAIIGSGTPNIGQDLVTFGFAF